MLSVMLSVGILPSPSRNYYIKEFIRLFPLTSARKLVYESGTSSFSYVIFLSRITSAFEKVTRIRQSIKKKYFMSHIDVVTIRT